MAMLCGNKSFNPVNDHNSCKKKQSSSSSSNQNPFSASGLDKFEKVLQELDRKKAKVLLRAKSHGDASVRFTYKLESEDWIPIIIRKREAKEAEARPAKANGPRKRLSAPPSLRVERGSGGVMKGTRRVVSWEFGRSCAWRGGRCWALVIIVILILGSLMIGRSFAICWATVSWYLAPLVSGGSSGLRGRELGRGVSGKSLRRKELRRGVSDRRLGGRS